MTKELYPGQSEIVAGKLRQDELLQQADREKLSIVTAPAERQILLRRIAGREGSLSTRRRYLASLTGDESEGVKGRHINIRVSAETYAVIEEVALTRGMTISAYLLSLAEADHRAAR